MTNIKQLSEDLFKLSPEQENAFNTEWVEKIKDYLKTKSPIIRLRVDNSRSYVGGSITLKTHLVDAVVVEGEIILIVQDDSSGKKYNTYINDYFKDATMVSPKKKIRNDGTRSYLQIVTVSTQFTEFLNKLAEAKEKLYIEYKVYKRSAEGKAHAKMNELTPDKKELVKNWFLNNIKKIEFFVPTGDLSEAPIETEFDQNLVDDIKDRFIDEQNKIAKWFNLDIAPDLYNSGEEEIATNVHLVWRWADGTEENRISNYKIWATTIIIYFNTPISQAPEEVKEVIKSAKARSTQGIYKETTRSISSNILGIEIINELFKGDIDFLRNANTDLVRTDISAENNIDPIKLGSKTPITPKHDLDLEFDDIDAYGDVA